MPDAVPQKTKSRLQSLPFYLLFPVPLGLIQLLLRKLIDTIVLERPELFSRIGAHTDSFFIIDPTNLPFVFRLRIHPDKPQLSAHRRDEELLCEASIAASLLTFIRLIDGQLDGDALFFNRELRIEGNVEAAVCLRNALDDIDGSIVDDIVAASGPISRPLKAGISLLRKYG